MYNKWNHRTRGIDCYMKWSQTNQIKRITSNGLISYSGVSLGNIPVLLLIGIGLTRAFELGIETTWEVLLLPGICTQLGWGSCKHDYMILEGNWAILHVEFEIIVRITKKTVESKEYWEGSRKSITLWRMSLAIRYLGTDFGINRLWEMLTTWTRMSRFKPGLDAIIGLIRKKRQYDYGNWWLSYITGIKSKPHLSVKRQNC